MTTIIQRISLGFLVAASTLSIYGYLQANRRFTRVRLANALPGDIMVSPISRSGRRASRRPGPIE